MSPSGLRILVRAVLTTAAMSSLTGACGGSSTSQPAPTSPISQPTSGSASVVATTDAGEPDASSSGMDPDAAARSANGELGGGSGVLAASPSASPPLNPTGASTPTDSATSNATSSTAAGNDEPEPVNETAPSIALNARHVDPTRPDPMHGQFSLAQATAGMPPGETLIADIETAMGTFTCTMLTAEAPLTVANFVGLARGVRPFWDPVAGRWTRRPYYDGSAFHRVIPRFMVQGGDILRSGRGGPGYLIRDENVTQHNAPGQLCMANRGPNTGGSQFFITEIPLPRLNGSYSVFGRCTPVDLVRQMARVRRARNDQPIEAVYIQRVTVHR